MRLEYLLDEINEEMLKKITENQKEKENLRYFRGRGKDRLQKRLLWQQSNTENLSNQASKDYCFDIERFTSF